ncbi:hypothetical protein KCP71_07390 [Salmonella enterica subsp. enterica]|nr:hypothetical protein KCP71_07390 [Salmonella enterica subsp. enterica]
MLEVLGITSRTTRQRVDRGCRVIIVHAFASQRHAASRHRDRPAGGTLMAGAILTETIFSWRCLGRYGTIDALQRRDYPVVRGRRVTGSDDDYSRQPAGRPAVRRGEPAYSA